MTDKDLTLLTEQERNDVAGIKEHIDASYSQECADRLASALIAARAENKRLLEEGRSLHDRLVNSTEHNQQLRHEATAALGFLQEWEASDFEAADESVQSSFHMTVEGLRRALLQSEKGGE